MKSEFLFRLLFLVVAGAVGVLPSCSDDGGGTDEGAADEGATADSRACDAEPELLTTPGGVEFVRTPDACFDGLPDWGYAARYVEIDGLRQAYVDEGPEDGEVVLLLHGQPSWSYLYRKMIPVLAEAGFRVIAMDHLGMGRSDKPIDIDYYSYLRHNERLERFIEELNLQDITLFAQDWGAVIGLRVAGLNTERFARIAAGDGMLPMLPPGLEFPAIEGPDEVVDIPSPFADIPAQQPVFYDGCELLLPGDQFTFQAWIEYALKSSSFHASEVLEALTWYDLPDDEAAAYDAPFPGRIYMTGPRTFPSLVAGVGGTTEEAWAGLMSFEGPVVAIWAANDPGNLGQCATQNTFICELPGAAGQPHARLEEAGHFLQDDQGAEIARRLVSWMREDGAITGNYEADCEEVANVPLSEDGDGEPNPRVGYEILNIISPSEIIVWVSVGLTQEEFDAIELPAGWFKNQPRESEPDGASFARSPDAAADGEFIEEEHFGHVWLHNATVIEANTPLDDAGLLRLNRIAKYHSVTYDAGRTLVVLVSPDGEQYVRLTRDAGRTSEEPTIPGDWQLVEHLIQEELTIELPNPTLNIRADNEDSFQGPIPPLDLGN